MDLADMIVLVLGTFIVMFLPGWIWSYVIFNTSKKHKEKIPLLERIMWSFLISISLVMFVFILFNDITALPVSPLGISLLCAIISIAGLLSYRFINGTLKPSG